MIVRRFLIPLGLLAGAAALVLSCRDATPVGVDARTSMLLAGRHAQRPAGDDSDDDGDEIEDGGNWLVIPQGALRDPVSITAVVPSDTVAMVRFRPEGLRFLSTALLMLTYDNCRI